MPRSKLNVHHKKCNPIKVIYNLTIITYIFHQRKSMNMKQVFVAPTTYIYIYIFTLYVAGEKGPISRCQNHCSN